MTPSATPQPKLFLLMVLLFTGSPLRACVVPAPNSNNDKQQQQPSTRWRKKVVFNQG
jgi:hypothetical protein